MTTCKENTAIIGGGPQLNVMFLHLKGALLKAMVRKASKDNQR